MFKKLLATGLTGIVLTMGLGFVAPATASAENLRFRVEYNDGHTNFHIGSRHDREFRKRHKRKHYRHGVCRPGKAVWKAERRGLRRAHVKRVGNRFVVVGGRKRGRYIKLAFYRDSPRCELAWVKRSTPRYNHYQY